MSITDTKTKDYGQISMYQTIIAELVDELNWRGRTDHRELAIRALRILGLSETDIRLYLTGELML